MDEPLDANQKKQIQKKIFKPECVLISSVADSLFHANTTQPDSRLTINLSYYGEYETLLKHLDIWSKASPFLPYVKFNIFDDGSDLSLVDKIDEITAYGINALSVYRITEDIPWNIPGVRNLAICICATNWILFQDMDQYFELESLIQLQNLSSISENGIIYTFARKNGRFTAGTMLARKVDLIKVHMHDEDTVGNYGFNDQLLRGKLFRQGIVECQLQDIKCEEFKTPLTGNRDTSKNEEKYYSILSRPLKPSSILNFNWIQVL
jgi:hypothetical protein